MVGMNVSMMVAFIFVAYWVGGVDDPDKPPAAAWPYPDDPDDLVFGIVSRLTVVSFRWAYCSRCWRLN